VLEMIPFAQSGTDKEPFLSIGIMAHNEENNMGPLLDEFIRQAESASLPFGITAVASGCTDKTEDIVKTYEKEDRRIHLLTEGDRKGKVSAINLFLPNAKGDVLIISSADIIPTAGAIRSILEKFADPLVGMVGGRPIPRPEKGLTASLNCLLWELHHEISLKKPKLGELIAMRNIVKKIPELVTTDEAALEAMILKRGFRVQYAPEAIIYNYGPKSLTHFIRQRIRNFIGHIYIKETMSYKVSTYDIAPMILLVIKKMKLDTKKIFLVIFLVCLETYARVAALYLFFIRKKRTLVWER